MQGFLEIFTWGGESGTFRGEHSVEDHYLHINEIINLGGVTNFLFFWGGGGRLPPPQKKNRPPGSPDMADMNLFYKNRMI